jgi:hypothetical protein
MERHAAPKSPVASRSRAAFRLTAAEHGAADVGPRLDMGCAKRADTAAPPPCGRTAKLNSAHHQSSGHGSNPPAAFANAAFRRRRAPADTARRRRNEIVSVRPLRTENSRDVQLLRALRGKGSTSG